MDTNCQKSPPAPWAEIFCWRVTLHLWEMGSTPTGDPPGLYYPGRHPFGSPRSSPTCAPAVLRVFYYPPDDLPGPQVRYLFAKSIAIKGIDGVRVEFWVRVATGPMYAPPGTFRTCPGGGGIHGEFRRGGVSSFTAAPSNPFALPKLWTLCILLHMVWAWDVCRCVLVVFGWVVCSPVWFLGGCCSVLVAPRYILSNGGLLWVPTIFDTQIDREYVTLFFFILSR